MARKTQLSSYFILSDGEKAAGMEQQEDVKYRIIG